MVSNKANKPERHSRYPITANPVIGKNPTIAGLPSEQLPFFICFGIVGFLGKFYLHWDWLWTIGIVAWMCGSFWLLSGGYPNKFLSQFHPNPKLRRKNISCQWQSNVPLPVKTTSTMNLPFGFGGRKIITPGLPSESYCVAEDAFDILCYVQVDLQGRQVGLRLLKAGKNRFKFTFDFLIDGEHPTLTEENAQTTLNNWESGLNGLPFGERMTVECESFSSDDIRQVELEEYASKKSNLLYALIRAQQQKAGEQKRKGLRNPKDIRITCTYTPLEKDADVTDIVGRALTSLKEFFKTFKGQKEVLDRQLLQQTLTHAYTKGYLQWDGIVNELMKLNGRIDTAKGLWERDWNFLHYGDAPAIPQLLVLNEKGISVEQNNALLCASVLLSGERGRDATPYTGREWVYVKDKYVGYLELGKFGEYTNAVDQLRHMWLPQTKTRDYRFAATFWVDDVHLRKFQLERQTRNAKELSIKALKSKTVDVNAEERAAWSIAARQAIERGENMIGVSAGVFLYRSNPQTLEQDLHKLATYFKSTTICETELAYLRWLQSLPFTCSCPSSDFYSNKYLYSSYEAITLLPLLNTQQIHHRGIELLAKEGGTPIYFNLYKVLRLAIFATSRGGKSVFLGEILILCLILNIPFIALDFPRPDGTSTFSDPINLLAQSGEKCFYVDTFVSSNNLLEFPDYSGLPKAEERTQEIRDFHVDAIVTLVTTDADDEQDIRDLVVPSLHDFYLQPEIVRRYKAANVAGYGTPEHENTPTLCDYLEFAEWWMPEYIAANDPTITDIQREAAGRILARLRGILKSSLGRAIGRPTSFRSDVMGLVFAFRNLSSNREAKILMLAAYSALLRRALESPISVCVLDELSILAGFPSIMRIVGQFCANGGKWGCSVIVSGQEPNSLAQTAVASQIFDNLTAAMCGHIKGTAIQSMSDVLGFERSLVAPYASSSAKPSAISLTSNWLINLDGTTHIECLYRSNRLMLALMANNLDESAARSRVMAAYEDPLEGLLAFANLYERALVAGLPMDTIQPAPQLLAKVAN
ncbi:MAG: hypothetical protein CLLPBCKN_007225 [Chroococcidiopsis cubana SAG 39.79]|uniref:ATPase n=1 Tax=Chroococcidiopsis cubana SAG 39.79 TaxID=388085 RepID=A0AB37URV9_9CYAN|nr:hypothetical protein [Chroococcidiopsis cubana]MDZ4877790.1 hypothetical protein [Chroococcidiopsis cubana SAG 39.79]PSB66624.1 hypothetical protein C7B79_00205 [Chroococcidiopsis cubana CCALA 043]PSB66643.1 hypothetical protein C7B79_00300 [Chroococcidiopsis cubana CCALA 043]RUT14070.1 hypothetical protein DSM107010_05530 [Chroococcidiopsis cubana SAG 39.79]